jgi:hypothetical protein
MSGSLEVAHISKDFYSVTAGSAGYWSWTFELGNAVPPGFQHHGTAATYEEAKAAVERNWQAWLEGRGIVTSATAPRD